ncbi:MAG TPA: Dps family protein [Flavobacteriales bacterium]|jgi:starvation-inducible DNA-binding protein|nr:Dps family protein [Flavobacteriales bacterium]
MKTKTLPANGNGKTAASQRHTLHWTNTEREQIVAALNELLANYEVHYQKLRNYHWNVKGSDFFDLHVELETQYREAQENIDLIAERVRVFRMRPLSTYAEYLSTSTIAEDGTVPESDKMVKNILADYVTLLDQCVMGVDVAVELHDQGTEKMLKDFIAQIEKHHWMLSAFAS